VHASTQGDAVELVFDDDGPGFETPEGVPGSTKPSGMGLGLLMTSELVRVSGGTLAMTNRPEGGAELRLRLPAAATRAA
jgi:two-component system sensor histidine kinase RegB